MKKYVFLLLLLFFITKIGRSQEVHNISSMDIGLRLHGENNYNYSPLQDVDGDLIFDQDRVYIHVNDIFITLRVGKLLDIHTQGHSKFYTYAAVDIKHLDKQVEGLKQFNLNGKVTGYSVTYDKKVTYGFYFGSDD